MRAFVLMAVFLCLSVPLMITDDSYTEECSDAVFVKDTEYGELYMVELNGGPLYYYQNEIDGQTVIKIVAFATMTLNIEAEV